MRPAAISRLLHEAEHVPEGEKFKKERKWLDDTSVTSLQQIADFEAYRSGLRDQLTLTKRPVETLKVFCRACVVAVMAATRYICTHSVNLYVVIPSFLLWLVLERFPGPHRYYVDAVEFAVVYVVWWVGLGILSSIGVGSGLQSGVLFLYPHIIKTCFVAQSCNSLNFESLTDIWFQSPPQLFKCRAPSEPTPHVTVFNCWYHKVILVCFLYSAGTAIGEIPPYWMTKSARLAAIEANNASLNSNMNGGHIFGNGSGNESNSSSFDNGGASGNGNGSNSSGATIGNTDLPPDELLETHDADHRGYIDWMKVWMVHFLQKHGFYGVLLLASFPNILFDVCGICCGYFLMPFHTFFAATFIGKAVVRNSYQSVLYVVLCSEKHLREFIRLLQWLTPVRWKLHSTIKVVLEDMRNSFQNLSQQGAAAAQANR